MRTDEGAFETARQWVSQRRAIHEAPNSTEARLLKSMANQIAGQAAAEDHGPAWVEEKLWQFERLLDAINSVLNFNLPGDVKEEEEDTRREIAYRNIWRHGNLQAALAQGLGGEASRQFTKDEGIAVATRYLRTPELSRPFLDWVFVDAFAWNEIVAFGEAIKERTAEFSGDGSGAYLDSRGNLEKMRGLYSRAD